MTRKCVILSTEHSSRERLRELAEGFMWGYRGLESSHLGDDRFQVIEEHMNWVLLIGLVAALIVMLFLLHLWFPQVSLEPLVWE
jgi:hypothetical protein